MNTLMNKKLLILGGSYQHIKIVKAAKELGIKTYVTDYLPIEKSPAKQMADVPLMYNITDIDNLVKLYKQEHIDSIIGPYLDVTQLPYQELCEKLNLPCFGNKEQHKILTDKIEFKNFCKKCGADIIPTYSYTDIENNENIEWPVLVKPNNSRGSRGQTICNNIDDVNKAISYAKQYSSTKKYVIEKYMGTTNDIEIAYIVINGEPILLKMLDRFSGSVKNKLDKLAIAEIFPSKFYKKNLPQIDNKLKSLINNINLKYSPVFIQAFIDKGTVRPYDPGIRLPGDNFDDIYKAITGIDIPKMLIEFALTGKISEKYVPDIKKAAINKASAIIMPCLKSGKIASIQGYEDLKQNPKFVSFSKAYNVGDLVEETNDIRQRFGEFCIVCSDFEELKKVIDELFNNLKVLNEYGENMLIEMFDTNLLNAYE